jgi:hypothetical protein
MQEKNNISKLDVAVVFIEKWAFVFLVLTPYLFISYHIITTIIAPPVPASKCGTGLFAAIICHFFIAAVATIILAYRFFISKKIPLIISIVILSIVIIMPFISYLLF